MCAQQKNQSNTTEEHNTERWGASSKERVWKRPQAASSVGTCAQTKGKRRNKGAQSTRARGGRVGVDWRTVDDGHAVRRVRFGVPAPEMHESKEVGSTLRASKESPTPEPAPKRYKTTSNGKGHSGERAEVFARRGMAAAERKPARPLYPPTRPPSSLLPDHNHKFRQDTC